MTKKEMQIKTKLQKKWTKILNVQLKISKKRLVEKFGEEFTKTLVAEVKDEFQLLLENMPIMDQTTSALWQNQLAGTIIFVAIYKAMKKYNYGADKAWEVCMITYGSYLKSLPKFIKSIMKKQSLSTKTMDNYKVDAVQLEKRIQPKGDRFDYIEGDGDNFIYGFEWKECAKAKFLREHNASEFMPYVCLSDMIISEAIDVGIVRSTCIADGDATCDFRFNDKGYTNIKSSVYKKEWDNYKEIWKNES